jgi:predicted TIM-barrel fold metal-dependent hydrolase
MTYPVIDADGHVTETNEQVAKYLEEPFRRRPITFSLYPWDAWDRRLLGTLGEWANDAPSWLRALDDGGMESTILYPTLGLFMSFLRDRAWAVALCRAYNTFLYEEFVRVSPRLQAVALLPVQDPDEAARELRRAVTELGMVGAMLAADGSHLLGDPRFLPIFEEAERLDTMLGIHASGSHLGGAGVDLFPRFIQAHTCSHPFGQMRQLTSIVFEGIPERFPRLRVAFLEAGAGWAPYWMERMDDEYAKRGGVEAPLLTRKPSDYVRSGSIYFSCEADEWLLPQAVRLIGENQIVYASDFPHWDHSFPGSIKEITERGDLTETQKRKILADNARRLYKLDRAPAG